MARLTANVVGTVGRDKDKVYRLTEMPASRGERWAVRVLMAMARAGHSVSGGTQGGMMALAQFAVGAFLTMSWADAEPLLEEMMSCVSVVHDPSYPENTRVLLEDDVEEIPTRIMIRKEVLKLHLNFSKVAVDLISAMEAEMAATSTGTSTSTSTSPSAS